jgi:hypothetical protein
MKANEETARKGAIEAWMLTIVRDGGVARLDDLHIDKIDEQWKPREMWIKGGQEAFRLALTLRDHHLLPLTVGLGFSLESRKQCTGVDFQTKEELMATLDWSPPSLYLFERGTEPRTSAAWATREGSVHPNVVIQDLNRNLFNSQAACYYIEFCRVGSEEYSRSVFLEG